MVILIQERTLALPCTMQATVLHTNGVDLIPRHRALVSTSFLCKLTIQGTATLHNSQNLSRQFSMFFTVRRGVMKSMSTEVTLTDTRVTKRLCHSIRLPITLWRTPDRLDAFITTSAWGRGPI